MNYFGALVTENVGKRQHRPNRRFQFLFLSNGFKIKVQIFPAKHGSFCTFILNPILMFRSIFFLLLGLMARSLPAQQHDNIWMFGYGGGSESPNNDKGGITFLNFAAPTLKVTDNQEIEMSFYETNASVCDSIGRLLFYTEGRYVEDASFQIMKNGLGLNPPSPVNRGLLIPQAALILPFPGRKSQYMLFSIETKYIDWPGWYVQGAGIFYSIVDMKQNNGLGEVVLKKQPLIVDTLEYGKLTAVKHANGRDWWLLSNESNTNRFYHALLSPKGIQLLNQQTIGKAVHFGLGQSLFSPDGHFFVTSNGIDQSTGTFIDIYRFDRCSGLLSDHTVINYKDNAWTMGAAISSNSRYLYIPSYNFIYQYDLWAADIEQSRQVVAEYDGFESPKGFAARFYLAQLAPDGKIYIATSNGTDYLHVIEEPDQPGLACKVVQHGLNLPTYNALSMPNFPNFRLGPLDGSPCDTLGLDNRPLARYRYQTDTLDYRNVQFTDLSSYEPTKWTWTFGDGTVGSAEVNPKHFYNKAGVYEVCLTVSNKNASNTWCRPVYVGTSAQEDPEVQARITVAPNPFGAQLRVSLSAELRRPLFRLYDQTGRLALEQPLAFGVNAFDTEALPPGFYAWELRAGAGERVKAGKLVKMRE
jgi:PKD domain